MTGAISVVLPVFNSAPFLERAVRSIRAQAGFELEIIAVDDGSTDGSIAVLRNIAAGDMTVLSQPHAGPAAARNAGIRVSRGEWIAFLDADDYWNPGKLDAQMAALTGDPKRDFSYSDCYVRNSRGQEQIQRAFADEENLLEALLPGPCFITASVIARRACFDRVGLFDPGLRSGEDWDMWLRLSAEFQGCHVAKPLCGYQASEQPDKYSAELMEFCTLRVVARILSNPAVRRHWPSVVKSRRRIFAWHCCVLAKTYWRRKRFVPFLRLALTSIGWHPVGAYYLSRSWRKRELPCLVRGPRRGVRTATSFRSL